MKIEDKTITPRKKMDHKFDDFIRTLKVMDVGQSFIVETIPSNFRIAMTVANVLLGREFVSRKENGKFRIGRVL